MDDHEAELDRLFRLAESRQISRRLLLRRAVALGLSAPIVAALLLACGGDDEEAAPTATRATTTSPTVVSGGTTPAAGGTPSSTATRAASPAAASPAAQLKSPSKNQTLIYPQAGDVRTFDPAGASETLSIEVAQSAYEGLVTQLPWSAEIAPRLATSWDFSSDAQQVTFKLQQGVKFHDGTMMDGEAVKKSFERVIQLNLANAAPLGGIDTIEAVDQFTVRFTLKEPNAYFVENLTQIGIISPTAVQQNDKGGDLAAAWLEQGNSAGTGPYRIAEHKKNETITIEAFKDYWRGWDDRKLTKIIYPIVPEAATRRQMLEKGEALLVRNLTPDDITALESTPGVIVTYTPSYQFWTMPMNTQKPPLDKLQVRQALQLAFPYDEYLKNVWFGHGTVPNSPTAPGFIGYTEDLPPFKQDLTKAKQLLNEAGITSGSIDAFYVETLAQEQQSETVLQDALRGLGLELKVQAMPWSTMFNLVSNRDTAPHTTNLIIGPTRPDPAFALEWAFGSAFIGRPYNWSYYSNPKVDDLISRAKRTVDRAQGAKLLEEANKLIVADAPVVWYVQPDRSDTYSAKLQNFQPILVGYPYQVEYYGMYLSD